MDALRWALGEQKSKNIRINQNTDVIFAGNQKETPAGFAEVELIFDNNSQLFPLDYSEVSIARRIDKDGSSNYYLNHQSCRLKDVIQLSAGAKLGLLGLAIVNQGAIEGILRKSPLELRMMLEENIGLKELELKKEEAKRKIINSINNLKEAEAREQEIVPHYHSLRRQVKRWEQRKDTQKQLSSLEQIYFASSLKRFLNNQPNKTEDQSLTLQGLRDQIAKLREEIVQEKSKLEEQSPKENNIDIRSITSSLVSLQQKKMILEQELRRSPSTKNYLSQEQLQKALGETKNKLTMLLTVRQLDDLLLQIKGIIKYLNNLLSPSSFKTPKDLSSSRETKQEILKLEQEILAKNKLLQDYQQRTQKQRSFYQDKLSLIEAKRSQIEKLLEKEQSLKLGQERLRLFIEEWEKQVQERGFSPEAIRKLAKNNSELVLANSNFQELERKIEHLRRITDEIGEEDQTIIDEYHEIEERYQFLTQQIKDLRITIQDLRELKNKLEKDIEKEFTQALNDINKSFSKYFQTMFQGGSARLERIKLIDNQIAKQDNQEFSWGIVLEIKIPKVRNSHIEMLSGGEKTLVAIALMFALVHQAAPPLLVMDEIDAALDEENSRRFAETLKELSKKTQFVIITHDRLTMRAANIIYGVTADIRGISELLSIKLEAAENLIKQGK